MSKYKEIGGKSDEDAPCDCRECDCETFDECNYPLNGECACDGKCCDATNKDDNPLLFKEKELVDA